MMQFHHYTLSDMENMVPWERYLYLDLLKAHIKEENEKAKEHQMMMQRQARK